jgi:hypothetical protein
MTEVNDLTQEQFEAIVDKNIINNAFGSSVKMGEFQSREPDLIDELTKPKKVEFIDTETYKEMREEWENIWPGKTAKVYQELNRVKPRCEHLIRHGLPYLVGKNVLEIGCNAGLQGYHIDKVAASYIGVEPGNKISKNPKPKTDYFLQAKKTEEFMSADSEFLNYTIEEFIENRINYKYNAFFASFALYHFKDKELNLLREYVWPECDIVLIQTRHQTRPTKHNKWDFWKPAKVEKYFTRLGFICHSINQYPSSEFINRRPKKHNGFSLQICVRPEYAKCEQ